MIRAEKLSNGEKAVVVGMGLGAGVLAMLLCGPFVGPYVGIITTGVVVVAAVKALKSIGG